MTRGGRWRELLECPPARARAVSRRTDSRIVVAAFSHSRIGDRFSSADALAMVARARVPSFENAIGIAKLSVSDITPDAFEREYVSRAVPAVLTDVTAAWPCAAFRSTSNRLCPMWTSAKIPLVLRRLMCGHEASVVAAAMTIKFCRLISQKDRELRVRSLMAGTSNKK